MYWKKVDSTPDREFAYERNDGWCMYGSRQGQEGEEKIVWALWDPELPDARVIEAIDPEVSPFRWADEFIEDNELASEEDLNVLNSYMIPPRRLMKKIKVKLRFIGKLLPRFHFDDGEEDG